MLTYLVNPEILSIMTNETMGLTKIHRINRMNELLCKAFPMSRFFILAAPSFGLVGRISSRFVGIGSGAGYILRTEEEQPFHTSGGEAEAKVSKRVVREAELQSLVEFEGGAFVTYKLLISQRNAKTSTVPR